MKHITCDALETLQERHGSLYHLASSWIEGTLAPELSDKILDFFSIEEEDLEKTWISIFEAVDALGAATTDKKVDFKSIRMFFLGVLGWTPSALRSARIDELADAFEGYRRFYNLSPASVSAPAASFMEDMMQKFPDRTEAACAA